MSKALIKFIRLSPTKARLIAREIQGMNAELAMASLKFMPNKGAKYIANAISSAVANGGFEANEVEILSCRVDAGAVLKRFQPRARGSASRIRKPTSHIFVEVGKAGEKSELQKLNESKKKKVAGAQTSAKADTSANSASKAEPKKASAPKSTANSAAKAPKAESAKSTKAQKPKTEANKEVKKEAKTEKPAKTTASKTTTAKKSSPKKTNKDA